MPRPRKNAVDSSDRPVAATNGARPWGTITEILAKDIVAPGSAAGRWAELWEDVRLRLEQTGRNFALAIPFDDPKVGENASTALRKYGEMQLGPDCVEVISRKTGKGRTVYVRRGEDYEKRRNGNGPVVNDEATG
ncbi:MAG TPA: hypothetical protein PKD09_10505 [Aggregatilinea sp.]|uniref:hypothetical protein n=1 Tax=Aggregatilinea sp. TaxID=2806333 RepID=UPI002B94E3DB|nr:hypothetical protein [Aggregatilinea sp.]HML22073.1 hypothetical protein [Aggregatilinea sp.]